MTIEYRLPQFVEIYSVDRNVKNLLMCYRTTEQLEQ